MIGHPNIAQDTQASIDTLKTQLDTIASHYSPGWFDQTGRAARFQDLQNAVNNVFQLNDAHNADSRYERVLAAIHATRQTMLNEDYNENVNRSWFFVNRKGYSALQHTLNQMHDCVLRQWLQDPKAVQHFGKYETKVTEQFMILLDALKKETEAFNNKQQKSTLLQWFNKKADSDNNVMSVINQFYDNNNIDNTKITAGNLESLNKLLYAPNTSMAFPDHIKALIEELRQPSIALATLQAAAAHPQQPQP